MIKKDGGLLSIGNGLNIGRPKFMTNSRNWPDINMAKWPQNLLCVRYKEGDIVRLKKTVEGVRKSDFRKTAKVIGFDLEIGGVHLSEPIANFSWWNHKDLIRSIKTGKNKLEV